MPTGKTPSVTTTDDAADDWRLLLALFPSTDILWIGSVFQSGASFGNHFRPRSEWGEEQSAPGQFICPNPFRAGESSRSNENISELRYFVVESDELPKEQIAALFRWLRGFLRLRAIVDTAGKRDRKSTRLNSSHSDLSRMPSSA